MVIVLANQADRKVYCAKVLCGTN